MTDAPRPFQGAPRLRRVDGGLLGEEPPRRRDGLVMPRLLAIVVGLTSAAAIQASPLGPIAVPPGTRTWESFGLVDRVRIRGDLAVPVCPSVTLVRLRENTRLPPHAAPADRTYLLLSGSLRVGVGKEWKDSALRTHAPGTAWFVPGDTTTFEEVAAESVVQVSSWRVPRDCARPDAVRFVTPGDVEWVPQGDVDRAVLFGDASNPACPRVERFREARGSGLVAAFTEPVSWTVLAGSLAARASAPDGPGELPGFDAGTVVDFPRGVREVRLGRESSAQREYLGSVPRGCALRAAHP